MPILRCTDCDEKIWRSHSSGIIYNFDGKTHSCKVAAPPSSNAPDAEAANRGTEVGPMRSDRSEAEKAFDKEVS